LKRPGFFVGKDTMQREIRLGTLASLKLTARPSVIIGSIGLWVVLSAIGIVLIKLSPGEAIIGGLIATGLHYAGDTFHQWGHSLAARRTGHPMIGIRYWGVLSTSIYPADEPMLPAAIHIRRALGGPIVSIGLGIIVGLIALTMSSSSELLHWLLWFIAFDNLVVFGLGALLPLGFTDGSTLLHYWNRR
jgi:hypothetical protein